MTARPRARQRGFTYLGMLFIVVLMSLGLTGAAQLWETANRRERERELLWVGTQYVKALRAYYRRSPGNRHYPMKLEELLEDKRFPMPVRHLRQLYRDPVGRGTDWGIIAGPDGRIVGLFSRATGQPLKQANFPVEWQEFAERDSYAAWRFVAEDMFRTPPKHLDKNPEPKPAGGTTP